MGIIGSDMRIKQIRIIAKFYGSAGRNTIIGKSLS